MKYNFDWDHKKAETNKKKHKVSFEQSATIFKDPNAISVFDIDHGDNEDRWLTLGLSLSGNLLVVSHTFNKTVKDSVLIRIISGRKATKKEQSQYGE